MRTIRTIGAHDNFFEVGGHSLLAMQVISRLRQVVGVEIPLRTIFEAPVVAELAMRLQQERHPDHKLVVPAIVPVSRNQDLPLSFAQQRLWFLHQLDPRDAAYNIPVAVRLNGQVDRVALEQALTELIQRHENLRTTFPSREGHPQLHIAPVPTTQLPILDLSYLNAHEVELIALRLAWQEAEQPFDLANGPLLRYWLLHLNERDQVLLLGMHHIGTDGWSMNILVSELILLYKAYVAGEPSPLTPLPIQYADYAIWQRQWLQGEVLKDQVRYWTHQLSEAHALELPTDYPRPTEQSHRGSGYNFHLDVQLTAALTQLSRQEGVTLFMTLLAAFQVLLYRLSGE
ncbi:MAG: condensation domain-containing protein, partial [Rickettsia endosymbiont of Ixodes persulcatus]|nr:condensation domain-containing protein [Rickettsia endosymbiont of Ixodes persulcatus]